MPRDPLPRLRTLCLALPEAHEVEAWGTSTFRVKTIFAMYSGPGNHHHAGRAGVWIKAAPANQVLMVRAAPDRFFVPPYVGPSGWIGVYLDSARTDWAELAELLRDAWRLSAPKKLVARVDAGESAVAAPRVASGRKKSATKKSATKKPKKKATTKATTKKATTRKKATTKKAKPGARKPTKPSGS